jgi:hypothetical protein
MPKTSDPHRRGGDAWAFLDADGKPLSSYLGWLHYETQQLRAWSRVHWIYGDTTNKKSRRKEDPIDPDALQEPLSDPRPARAG